MFFFNQEFDEEKTIKDYVQDVLNYLEFKYIFLDYSEIQLKGFGFFYINDEVNKGYEAFHVFFVNNSLFAVSGHSLDKPRANSKIRLKNFYLLDHKILKDPMYFNGSLEEGFNFYNSLGINLKVDFKFYEYENETRLVISKSGDTNINLYFAVVIKNDLPQEFTVKVNPSVLEDSKHLKMIKILDERLKK